AWQYARYQGRLERACRALVDVDLDRFSPVAWGGDCDDFDAKRNPFAHEGNGRIDANCNGVTPSDKPSDADRGLAPAFGDPSFGAGAIDRVVLVTIDCARYEMLDTAHMPSLARFATRGVAFDRLYSGATSTGPSMRIALRGGYVGDPIMAKLSANGVATTAI